MSEPAEYSAEQAADPLANIAFINLPADFNYELANFQIDPQVALPIELEPGAESVSPDDLTWDATVAAMLRVIAYLPSHRDADYYRRFVLAAKPAIKADLTEAGIIKAHNGDFAIAEELFMALIGLFPEDATSGLNLAFAYEEHANAEERGERQDAADKLRANAEHAYRRVLELEPLHAEAHLNFAHFYVSQRRYAEARPHLEVYTKHGTDAERRDEAERLLEQIGASGLDDGLFREAHELINGGSEHEGIAAIERFLAARPGVWQAHFLHGWGLRRTEQYAEARDAFTVALEAGAEHGEPGAQADTYNELAICNLELGELDEAEGCLRRALELDPENTKILSNMAILALKRGRSDEARRFFAAILELDPGDPLAQQYLQQLEA